jgi:hypothetical protein
LHPCPNQGNALPAEEKPVIPVLQRSENDAYPCIVILGMGQSYNSVLGNSKSSFFNKSFTALAEVISTRISQVIIC